MTATTWKRTRIAWAHTYDSDLDRAWLHARAEIGLTTAVTWALAALTIGFIAIAAIAITGSTGIGGYRLMRTVGNSMLPNLTPETLIAVQCDTDTTDVSIGDIIVFQDLDPTDDVELISHRVTAIDATGITTKGDNNDRPDAYPVTDANLVGIVRAQAPDMGRILTTDTWNLIALGCILLGTGLATIALQMAREPYWNEVLTAHDQLSKARHARHDEIAKLVAKTQAARARA